MTQDLKVQVQMCDTDQVDAYEEIAKEFLQEILGIDSTKAFISDESDIDDFVGAGNYELDYDLPYSQMKSVWLMKVRKAIEDKYHIDLDRNERKLVNIFKLIRAKKNSH